MKKKNEKETELKVGGYMVGSLPVAIATTGTLVQSPRQRLVARERSECGRHWDFSPTALHNARYLTGINSLLVHVQNDCTERFSPNITLLLVYKCVRILVLNCWCFRAKNILLCQTISTTFISGCIQKWLHIPCNFIFNLFPVSIHSYSLFNESLISPHTSSAS